MIQKIILKTLGEPFKGDPKLQLNLERRLQLIFNFFKMSLNYKDFEILKF